MVILLKTIENKLNVLVNDVIELSKRVKNIEKNICEDPSDECNESEIIEQTEQEHVDMNFLFPKEKKSHLWMVSSHTDSSVKYKVTYNPNSNDNAWACTCPAFNYRKMDNYKCKHINQIIENEF